MKLIWITILGFFMTAPYAGAQSTSTAFELTKTLPGNFSDFTIDNLGNIYLLTAGNQLRKVGPNGDSLAVFNDVRRYGKISTIDATNPLKLLVYYKEFTVVVELDRFLNMVNTVDFRKPNILQAKAVCLAYDNNIWVYDELDAKLKRVGDDASLVDQTNDFRQLFDSVPDPVAIRDQGGLVYLYDTTKGVYVFDRYGGFKTRITMPGLKDFDVVDKNIIARDDAKFYRYQLGTLDLKEEAVPAWYGGALHIRITPGIVYVLKRTGLEIYSKK